MAGDGSSGRASQFERRRVVPAQVIASCFALAAFAVAIISGLSVDLSATSVLLRAVVSMIVCYPVGLLIGMVCQRVVQEHLESYRRASPLPTLDDDEDGGGEPDAPDGVADEEEILTV